MSKTQTTTGYALLLDSEVQLDDSNKSGKFKHFSKMLAAFGEFVDPRGGKKPMVLDEKWAQGIVDNFNNGPIKRVPMVMGHPQTSAELAEKTRGWLKNLEIRADGLYGIFDIRKKDTAEDIENGLLEQTSVAFDDNYQDKRTGKWYQNVLKHVGLVNDPYIKGMDAMEPVEMSGGAAAAVLFSDAPNNNNNQEEEVSMGKIKNDREFPVEVTYTENEEEKKVTVEPGAEIEVPDDQVEAVTKQIADAVAPKSEDEEDEELSEADKKAKELAEREAAAAKKEAELAEREATADYERLLSEGKIVPAQKEAFIALSSKGSASVELSDGESKTVSVLLAELFEAAPAGKHLSEEGKEGGEGGEEEEVELSDEEKSLGDDFGNTPEEIAEFKKNGSVSTKKEEE
jgi:hypothetical protein